MSLGVGMFASQSGGAISITPLAIKTAVDSGSGLGPYTFNWAGLPTVSGLFVFAVTIQYGSTAVITSAVVDGSAGSVVATTTSTGSGKAGMFCRETSTAGTMTTTVTLSGGPATSIVECVATLTLISGHTSATPVGSFQTATSGATSTNLAGSLVGICHAMSSSSSGPPTLTFAGLPDVAYEVTPGRRHKIVTGAPPTSPVSCTASSANIAAVFAGWA